jgi:hypothetical protein
MLKFRAVYGNTLMAYCFVVNHYLTINHVIINSVVNNMQSIASAYL